LHTMPSVAPPGSDIKHIIGRRRLLSS